MLGYPGIFWYKLGYGRVSLFQLIDMKQYWKLTAVPVRQSHWQACSTSLSANLVIACTGPAAALPSQCQGRLGLEASRLPVAK